MPLLFKLGEQKMDYGKKIFLAVDTADLEGILPLIENLNPLIGGLKFGPTALTLHSPGEIVAWAESFCGITPDRIFIDVKYHDVPEQVRLASRVLAQLGVGMFTVHASGNFEMIRAAVQGVRDAGCDCGKHQPKVLAVTVLTSLGERACKDSYCQCVGNRVKRFTTIAKNAGADGIVASAQDLIYLREPDMAGNSAMLRVVTGIRPVWSPQGDQVRFMTPADAIQAGADLLVIGRPITNPPLSIGDSVEAFKMIVSEMEEALSLQTP